MKIVEKKTSELIPYKNNPRDNDKAVDGLMNSIREFGFKVPMVITQDNVVVTGHTRLKAAIKLGMKTVPAIVADDLTEEQIKAFRLADNKVSELATWDIDKLEIELGELDDIGVNMDDFGFEEVQVEESPIEPDDKGIPDFLNFLYVPTSHWQFEGTYGIPVMKSGHLPEGEYNLTMLNMAYQVPHEKRKQYLVSLHLQDYLIERTWSKLKTMREFVSTFGAVLTPDFSQYTDMPRAMQIWNHYRRMFVGRYWQDAGVNVIVSAEWSDKESFEYCFDGMPHNSLIEVSTVGIHTNKEWINNWKRGFEKMLEVLEPSELLIYGKPFDIVKECGVKYTIQEHLMDKRFKSL